MIRTNRVNAVGDCPKPLEVRAWHFRFSGIAKEIFAALALCSSLRVNAELPAPDSFPAGSEWGLLPAYCPDTQGFGKYGMGGSPNSAKWVSLMGDTFWALHHYCFGILKLNRSQVPAYPIEIRRGLQKSALSEFSYVISHMPDNYVLAPEVYTYVGRARLLLGQPGDADAAFAKARKAKPDYWPAYSWWATYLANNGKKEQARAIVAEGLQHAPESRTLQLIMRELGPGAPDSAATKKPAER